MVIQIDWQHEYLLGIEDYPISDNNRPATYDQFITLRDTLIMSNKYYADKAGRSLIIGTKLNWKPTDTIEIREPNLCKMSFEPWYEADPSNKIDSWDSQWKYVTIGASQTTNPLSCTIQKDGRYRISHKEQFVQLDSGITRILSYVNQHHEENDTWTEKPRAVFDWEWATGGEIIRMTTYWYVECDLYKWDWLELLIEDQNGDHIDSTTWKLQTYSNWWNVEYIDLPYRS